MREEAIREGGIRLGQLLKLAGLASSGAQAKQLILEGAVTVNGEPESRRGRQLEPGDVVEANGERVRLVSA
ncbi:MAG: RNA-binding S4 domain-containing protein [Thermoleophilaceae bacterium]